MRGHMVWYGLVACTFAQRATTASAPVVLSTHARVAATTSTVASGFRGSEHVRLSPLLLRSCNFLALSCVAVESFLSPAGVCVCGAVLQLFHAQWLLLQGMFMYVSVHARACVRVLVPAVQVTTPTLLGAVVPRVFCSSAWAVFAMYWLALLLYTGR